MTTCSLTMNRYLTRYHSSEQNGWFHEADIYIAFLLTPLRTVLASRLQRWVTGIQYDANWPRNLTQKNTFFCFCGSINGAGKRDTFLVPHIAMSPKLAPESGTDFVPELEAMSQTKNVSCSSLRFWMRVEGRRRMYHSFSCRTAGSMCINAVRDS